MPDRLLVRLAPDGSLSWLRQSAGTRAASSAGAPPADVLAGASERIVLVPGEDVLITEARIGARNRAQLLKALPYAVEDQLLSPVEELHFAASTPSADGAITVAVVARDVMARWLQRLADAGVQADALVPDTLALAGDAANPVAMIEDSRALVRLGPATAFACSPAELAPWFAQLAEGTASAPIEVHDFRAAPPLALVGVGQYRERQRDPLAMLAQGFSRVPLNLLDGEFAQEHRNVRGARWWRVAAVLAAAVLVLALANLGFGVLQLARASARLDALAQESVRKAFPDIDAAQLARLSPVQLMRSRLDREGSGAVAGGLLRTLSQIAPVLGATTRIQTRGMEYRNGTLELALRAPDVAALDSVRERIATLPGVKVDVTAAVPGADGVDGRLRIAGGTP